MSAVFSIDIKMICRDLGRLHELLIFSRENKCVFGKYSFQRS